MFHPLKWLAPMLFVGVQTLCVAQEVMGRANAALASPNAFTYPQSVFVDAGSGHIWVSDFDNHRVLRFDVTSLTSVEAEGPSARPTDLVLRQNYPNPFNPMTVIRYDVPASSPRPGQSPHGHVARHIALRVYDMLGREVATLVDEFQEPGPYAVSFNVAALPSGVYYYALRSLDGIAVKTMCVIK